MKKKSPMVNILSPDGITIRLEDFENEEEAKAYFDQWLKRYERQGYYSANFGRIPLHQVWDYCDYVYYE